MSGSRVDPQDAMTPQEIALTFREREIARINVEGDGCVTALDEVESYLDGYENGVFDSLSARSAVVRPTRRELEQCVFDALRFGGGARLATVSELVAPVVDALIAAGGEFFSLRLGEADGLAVGGHYRLHFEEVDRDQDDEL